MRINLDRPYAYIYTHFELAVLIHVIYRMIHFQRILTLRLHVEDLCINLAHSIENVCTNQFND